MSDPGRARSRLIGWLAASSALAAGIVAMPKQTHFASYDRLVETIFLFAVVGVGAWKTADAFRDFRDTRLLARFGGISSAVRDTITFIRNERLLAWRGTRSIAAIGWATSATYVLAHWPQFAVLRPWQNEIGSVALIVVAAVPLNLVFRKRHQVNVLTLRRYLREQLDHLGARRVSQQQRWRAGNPVVEVLGEGRFSVAGFELDFEDLKRNALVTGQTGSGKTQVLNSLLEGLIASNREPGQEISGIILDAKGDFYDKLLYLAKRYGRAKHVVIFDPGAWEQHPDTFLSIAWNPLDNADDANEVSYRLIAVLRMLGLETGNEGSYWLDSARIFIRQCIVLVRHAELGPAPSLVDVLRLVQEGEDHTPLFHEIIRRIHKRYPDRVPGEVDHAIKFMNKNFANMADREKSALRGTVTQLLDEFQVWPFSEMLTYRSTISIPDMIDTGKLFYIRMPASGHERMSRLIITLAKVEYMRCVLNRPRKDRRSFLLGDEYQVAYTMGDGRGDSDAFERTRESNHCSKIATQNLEAFYKKIRGGEHDIRNFLSHCNFKVMLRNDEEHTNLWASRLFAERSEIVISANEQAALEGGFFRARATSYGRTTRLVPTIPVHEFLRLTIPSTGPNPVPYAESIVHIGSRSTVEHRRVIWPVNPLRG